MFRRSLVISRLVNYNFVKLSRRKISHPVKLPSLSSCRSDHVLRTSHVLNDRLTDFRRYKSKKSKPRAQDSDSDSSDDESEEVVQPGEKLITCRIKSTRVDSLVKTGLGISNNKTETLFYESKIRLNGQKIPKKSVKVVDGDEIDVIKGPSQHNPDLLTIARIEVVKTKVNDDEDGYIVKVKRFKSLNVENYEGINAWTANSV